MKLLQVPVTSLAVGTDEYGELKELVLVPDLTGSIYDNPIRYPRLLASARTEPPARFYLGLPVNIIAITPPIVPDPPLSVSRCIVRPAVPRLSRNDGLLGQ